MLSFLQHTPDNYRPLNPQQLATPFADATFDVAFLAEVIGEVPDQPACLNSLARVIKPGGVLVFEESFPDPDRLTVTELRELAEPAGFAFLEARGGRWRDVVRFERRAD
nr:MULTISPECIES: methyltransferase domain-containing protein [unclassified Mycobacterium]